MSKAKLLLAGLFASVLLLLPAAPASAATEEACSDESAGFLSFPTWYKYLDYDFDDDSGECKVDINLTENPSDIAKILLAVVEILLRVGGLVSVGFVIFGGFKFILSQGEPENAKAARMTVINALIGLGIAASATAVVNLIGNNLIG